MKEYSSLEEYKKDYYPNRYKIEEENKGEMAVKRSHIHGMNIDKRSRRRIKQKIRTELYS